MSQILFQYHAIHPTTWVYLSSLLLIGLFFKFSRFWSVRNLDLLMLLLLAPGMLMVHFGYVEKSSSVASSLSEGSQPKSESLDARGHTELSRPESNSTEGDPTVVHRDATPTVERSAASRLELSGYTWLLTVSLLWFIRMLLDTRLTRRPLLSPNLSIGGMAFMGIALFVFLMANVLQDRVETTPDEMTVDQLVDARMEQIMRFQMPDRGPGNAALRALPVGMRKVVAILSHLAVVVGMALIAYRHFGNATNGIGAATLYLMLPYTSQMTGRVDHFLPAALLVWAVFFYRAPFVAGLFLGAACGSIYYPLFLLPLWIGFYWHRGGWRFVMGVAVVLSAMTVGLSFAPGEQSFWVDVQQMFGVLKPQMEGLEGIWNIQIGGWDAVFRLPILVAVVALAFSLLLWPAQKNLSTLISCSAAVMVANQFWHGFGGGLFVAWYLPFALLMIFRPNLEDRVGQSMVPESRMARRGAAASG